MRLLGIFARYLITASLPQKPGNHWDSQVLLLLLKLGFDCRAPKLGFLPSLGLEHGRPDDGCSQRSLK